MNFLSPMLLLGLLAVAIPPILHLIQRRKPKHVRFPAIELIRRSQRKTAHRFRAKQLLLLLLRCAFLALLALALARPIIREKEAQLVETQDVLSNTVWVLDASYPMAYRLEGESLFEKGQRLVEDAMARHKGLGALILAGTDGPDMGLTEHFEEAQLALRQAKTGYRTDDLPMAVARAYSLLSSGTSGSKRVVVLSYPAHLAQLPPPPDASIECIPVDVSNGQPLENTAIVDVSLTPASDVGEGFWRIEGRVARFADTPIENWPIHLECEGEVLARGFLSLKPGEMATKTFYARFDQHQAASAALVLGEDALPLDDRRMFLVQAEPTLRVLAVDGEPSPTPHRDELFYVEQALSRDALQGIQLSLERMDELAFAEANLNDFDVVILANVAGLNRATAQNLESFLRKGGGLLITAGSRATPKLWNAQLGAFLPRMVRDVRRAGDAAASLTGGDRKVAHIGRFLLGHPMLAPFANPSQSSLSEAKVKRYLLLDPNAETEGDVVMQLEDGAPLLLTRPLGEGQVALLTTSIDRDWGELPIRPDFLPLLQQMMRVLTRVSAISQPTVSVGQPVDLAVALPQVERVRVTSPSGRLSVVEAPWRFEVTDELGAYKVESEPILEAVSLPGFAVAVDGYAGDLRGKSAKSSDQAQNGSAAFLGDSPVELWHAALIGLFFLLLMESGVLAGRLKPSMKKNERV